MESKHTYINDEDVVRDFDPVFGICYMGNGRVVSSGSNDMPLRPAMLHAINPGESAIPEAALSTMPLGGPVLRLVREQG